MKLKTFEQRALDTEIYVDSKPLATDADHIDIYCLMKMENEMWRNISQGYQECDIAEQPQVDVAKLTYA